MRKAIPTIWKPIPGFVGHYEVSDQGEVRSIARSVISKHADYYIEGRLLKQDKVKGYLRVTCSLLGKTKRFLTHRLVATVFIPNPKKLKFVNHLKGIKTDNRASQLAWCTRSENETHAYQELGKIPPLAKAVKDTLTNKIYTSISKAAVAKGVSPKFLLKRFYTGGDTLGLIRI